MEINVITLGCSKNLVDSEKLLGQLLENGHRIYHNASKFTECIIINTCGFILDAKTESIETILNYVKAKNEGRVKKVFVMGCLSERYKKSLQEEIPEIDGFFGVWDQKAILSTLNSQLYTKDTPTRVITTPSHYAYLKIAEGCNRNCAFCSIPDIRGSQISIPVGELVAEAQFLASQGVKELILIAQDPSSYGTDLYQKKSFINLIEQLVLIEEFEWIRLHYFHPLGFPARGIVELMKKHRKICRYLDMPVQHADNKILKSMNRGHEISLVNNIIELFRAEIPDICIRTTLITGFPGEGKKEFTSLKEYVRNMKFDKLGAFAYSHEEGTIAGRNINDSVSPATKKKRLEEIMEIQEEIALEKNQKMIGQTMKVIVDKREGDFYIARTEFDSPEVDNEVLIPAGNTSLIPGSYYEVKIVDASGHDLIAKLQE